MREELEKIAMENGYFLLQWKRRGDKDILCGLFHFAFTTGMVMNIDETGYEGRYCFPNRAEAITAILSLPEELPEIDEVEGNWIKYKGRVELTNKNYQK